MAINTKPIFSGLPAIGGVVPSAANTKSDGSGTIGTDIFLAFTADATTGSYVMSVRIQPIAAVAATATTATTIRVYVSTLAAGATTSANTRCIAEISMASQTASHSTNATFFIEVPLDFALPPGNTILITQHVASAANTGYQCTVFAGDYTAQP